MIMLRALGFRPKPTSSVLRAKLPAANSYVDVAVPGGRGTVSVCVDEVDAKGFTCTAPPEVKAGSVAVFVYRTETGKYRFNAKCHAVQDALAAFELPKSIETLAKFGGTQKRQTVRIDAVVPAQWRPASGGQGRGEFTRASITDISRSGASLIIGHELAKGTQVELRCTLNSELAPVTLLSEVMRSSKIGKSGKVSLGLKFHGIRPEDDRAIMEFINKRQAERRDRGLA
jgi:c-di-GMP-binding flagellar brake protein YcgR